MFKLVITNKKPVEKTFNSVNDLYDYAVKNRYKQGYADLYHNGTKVDLGIMGGVYGVFSWCLAQK